MFISFSLFMASFAFSFAGFGYALVAVPLLSLILPVKMAVAIQFPFSVLLVLFNAWRYGSKLKWKDFNFFILGAAVAVPLGAFSLNILPELMMKRILAVFIVLTVITARMQRSANLVRRFADSIAGGVFLGGVSGWFAGAYTTGGPPAVIYATARFSDIEKVKGIMGIYFLFTDIVVMAIFLFTGVITEGTLTQSVIYSPAVILGFVAGMFLLKRISHRGYMIGVHCLLLVTAVMLSIQ